MIRVVLPFHLRNLVGTDREVTLNVDGRATIETVLDALEEDYPVLRGTVRDHITRERRAFLRFFACQRDLSHDPSDRLLPEAVILGEEPFRIVGAMAGG